MIEIVPNWHPIFVHFTIALWSVSAALFVLARIAPAHPWRTQWMHVARWNLWIGSGFAVATALAGWYAYNTVAHDAPSHAAMTAHRNWALATLALFLPLAFGSMWRHRGDGKASAPFLVVLLIALGLLVSTGWRGGELVYRYGLGVMSLPQTEGEGHGHGTGGAEGDAHGAAPAPHTEAPGETSDHGEEHGHEH